MLLYINTLLCTCRCSTYAADFCKRYFNISCLIKLSLIHCYPTAYQDPSTKANEMPLLWYQRLSCHGFDTGLNPAKDTV